MQDITLPAFPGHLQPRPELDYAAFFSHHHQQQQQQGRHHASQPMDLPDQRYHMTAMGSPGLQDNVSHAGSYVSSPQMGSGDASPDLSHQPLSVNPAAPDFGRARSLGPRFPSEDMARDYGSMQQQSAARVSPHPDLAHGQFLSRPASVAGESFTPPDPAQGQQAPHPYYSLEDPPSRDACMSRNDPLFQKVARASQQVQNAGYPQRSQFQDPLPELGGRSVSAWPGDIPDRSLPAYQAFLPRPSEADLVRERQGLQSFQPLSEPANEQVWGALGSALGSDEVPPAQEDYASSHAAALEAAGLRGRQQHQTNPPDRSRQSGMGAIARAQGQEPGQLQSPHGAESAPSPHYLDHEVGQFVQRLTRMSAPPITNPHQLQQQSQQQPTEQPLASFLDPQYPNLHHAAGHVSNDAQQDWTGPQNLLSRGGRALDDSFPAHTAIMPRQPRHAEAMTSEMPLFSQPMDVADMLPEVLPLATHAPVFTNDDHDGEATMTAGVITSGLGPRRGRSPATAIRPQARIARASPPQSFAQVAAHSCSMVTVSICVIRYYSQGEPVIVARATYKTAG